MSGWSDIIISPGGDKVHIKATVNDTHVSAPNKFPTVEDEGGRMQMSLFHYSITI